MSKVVFDAKGNRSRELHDLDVKRKKAGAQGKSLADLYRSAGAPKKEAPEPAPKFDAEALKQSVGIPVTSAEEKSSDTSEMNLGYVGTVKPADANNDADTEDTIVAEPEEVAAHDVVSEPVDDATAPIAPEEEEKTNGEVAENPVAEEAVEDTVVEEVTKNPVVEEPIHAEVIEDSTEVVTDVTDNIVDHASDNTPAEMEISKLDLANNEEHEEESANETTGDANNAVDATFVLETITVSEILDNIGVAEDFIVNWLIKCAGTANIAPGIVLVNSKFNNLRVYTRRTDFKRGIITSMIGFGNKFGLVRVSEKDKNIVDCVDQLTSDGVVVKGLGCIALVSNVEKRTMVI